MKLHIFTDGSSRGNPGPGGWGAVAVINHENGKSHIIELGGGEKKTTNNQMELKAPIEALKYLRNRGSKSVLKLDKNLDLDLGHENLQITIYTDSSYVINGITKWIHGWKRNGWITKTKEDVLNKDLWMELGELAANVQIKWHNMSGHVGILGNERADYIATAFADGQNIKLFDGDLKDYDLPDVLNITMDENKAKMKKSNSTHSKSPAFSYVSMVQGIIEVHHTWAECEKRVKRVKGARYKKALSREEQERIIAEFEAI